MDQMRRELLTWKDVDALIDHLIPQFEGGFEAMVMITRGGIIPGGILAEAMDITHILLNNSELGKISKEQRAGEWPVWETDLHNPDFSKFAELCGAKGLKVTNADQLDTAIREALNSEGPALVEIMTDVELI